MQNLGNLARLGNLGKIGLDQERSGNLFMDPACCSACQKAGWKLDSWTLCTEQPGLDSYSIHGSCLHFSHFGRFSRFKHFSHFNHFSHSEHFGISSIFHIFQHFEHFPHCMHFLHLEAHTAHIGSNDNLKFQFYSAYCSKGIK